MTYLNHDDIHIRKDVLEVFNEISQGLESVQYSYI